MNAPGIKKQIIRCDRDGRERHARGVRSCKEYVKRSAWDKSPKSNPGQGPVVFLEVAFHSLGKIMEHRVSGELGVESQYLKANRVQFRDNVLLRPQQGKVMISGGVARVGARQEGTLGTSEHLCVAVA
jgi:hypothetical protein